MEFAHFRKGTHLEKHDFINKAFKIQVFISLNIISSTIKINDRFHIKCPSFENKGLNMPLYTKRLCDQKNYLTQLIASFYTCSCSDQKFALFVSSPSKVSG